MALSSDEGQFTKCERGAARERRDGHIRSETNFVFPLALYSPCCTLVQLATKGFLRFCGQLGGAVESSAAGH